MSSVYIEDYLPVVKYNGLNTAVAVDFSGSASVALPSGTTIGGSAVVALGDITSSATTGNMFSVTNSGVYTGTGVVRVIGNSATTGSLMTIAGNALSDGIALSIASSSTALTATGRLLKVAHTGNAGVSTIVAEIASAAADETVVFQVTASAALAAGTALKVSGASVTTGTLISAANGDALTTGALANLTSNSADTTARNLVKIVNDNTAAVGAVPLYLQQDAVGTTHFKTLILLGTIGIYVSDETSPNTLLTAAKGSICLNGSATGQAYWNTDGATAWTALA